jgi:twitching motility two-component system response regulator PilH
MSRILVVDDSPTEVHVLSTMLTKHGFEIITASSGEEAIDTAKAERPDLVLMDVVMPGMNGFQATRLLTRQTETASIPVIMVTTKDQETDRIWGLRQGAKDYITKPVVEDELVGKINEAIGG